MNANLIKVQNEVAKIKDKQTTLSTTFDSAKKTDYERELAQSLQKPAQMLDELKSHFQKVMETQSEEMKKLVQ